MVDLLLFRLLFVRLVLDLCVVLRLVLGLEVVDVVVVEDADVDELGGGAGVVVVVVVVVDLAVVVVVVDVVLDGIVDDEGAIDDRTKFCTSGATDDDEVGVEVLAPIDKLGSGLSRLIS